MKRVLVLHGWTQNGQIFKERLNPFCRECEKRNIELVFLDGPHRVDAESIIEAWTNNPAFAQDVRELDLDSADLRSTLAASDPRAWWSYDREKRAHGLKDTFDVVKQALRQNTFDGVFGYSQGAALAALVATVLERPDAYPPFLEDGRAIHPPLQFCVAISGYRPIDPIATKIFEPSYDTCTLHILGRADSIVPVRRSQHLIDLGTNKRVVIHEEAHIIPLTPTWIDFFCAFIEEPSLETTVPPPAQLSSTGGAGQLKL